MVPCTASARTSRKCIGAVFSMYRALTAWEAHLKCRFMGLKADRPVDFWGWLPEFLTAFQEVLIDANKAGGLAVRIKGVLEQIRTFTVGKGQLWFAWRKGLRARVMLAVRFFFFSLGMRTPQPEHSQTTTCVLVQKIPLTSLNLISSFPLYRLILDMLTLALTGDALRMSCPGSWEGQMS